MRKDESVWVLVLLSVGIILIGVSGLQLHSVFGDTKSFENAAMITSEKIVLQYTESGEWLKMSDFSDDWLVCTRFDDVNMPKAMGAYYDHTDVGMTSKYRFVESAFDNHNGWIAFTGQALEVLTEGRQFAVSNIYMEKIGIDDVLFVCANVPESEWLATEGTYATMTIYLEVYPIGTATTSTTTTTIIGQTTTTTTTTTTTIIGQTTTTTTTTTTLHEQKCDGWTYRWDGTKCVDVGWLNAIIWWFMDLFGWK